MVTQDGKESKPISVSIAKGSECRKEAGALIIALTEEGVWYGGEVSNTKIHIGMPMRLEEVWLLVLPAVTESAAHNLPIQPGRGEAVPDGIWKTFMDILDKAMSDIADGINITFCPPPRGISGNQILVEICELELAAIAKKGGEK